MSDYGYDDGPRRHRSTRAREPDYVTETTYIQRGTGQPSRELVYRAREDSIEDIPRDFPPGTEYRRTKIRDEYDTRRTRSVGHRDPHYDDYYEYGGGPAAAAGAAAGYAAARGRPRPGRDDDYYSDYEPPRRERRKSKVGEVLEDLGLGGVAAAIVGHKDKGRSRSRRRGDDRDRSRSRSRGHDKNDMRKKWQQAAQAAIIAGATEAVRSRKEPGPWTGAKGQRIATAALGAAGIDGLLDRDPHQKSKRHMLEAVIGGLAANRIANGPRSRSGSRGRSDSRGRSLSRSLSRPRSLFGRSKSRGQSGSRGGGARGLKEVAALGGVAAVGKAIYDRVRSKSRGRARSNSSSGGDNDGVAARRNRYNEDSRGAPEDDNRVARPRDRDQADERKRDSSSDSVSSTDLENQRKKMRAYPAANPAYGYYADGNPYAAAGTLPPPPMGAVPARY